MCHIRILNVWNNWIRQIYDATKSKCVTYLADANFRREKDSKRIDFFILITPFKNVLDIFFNTLWHTIRLFSYFHEYSLHGIEEIVMCIASFNKKKKIGTFVRFPLIYHSTRFVYIHNLYKCICICVYLCVYRRVAHKIVQ